MRTLTLIFPILFAVCLSGSLASQAQPVAEPWFKPETWSNDYEPFRIAGNLYYVGTEDLASYLITTSEGHILINTGIASSTATIRKHVEALGFRFADIKILLTTHAHYDHVGAMAEIKKLTGARLMANKHDAPLLADGGKSDYVFGGDTSSFEPVRVDKQLDKQSVVTLGKTEITALHHPGHTKGATSFLLTVRDSNRSYRVLIANMPSIVFDEKFSELRTYPNAASDYAYTFQSLRSVQFDIWLASHASQFGLQDKHPVGAPYNPMAFSSKEDFHKRLDELYQKYLDKLKQQ